MLIDFRHRYSIPGFEERLTWVAGFQSQDEAGRLQSLFDPGNGWYVVAHTESVVLLHRGKPVEREILYRPLAPAGGSIVALVGSEVALMDVEIQPTMARSGDQLRLRKVWMSLRDSIRDFGVQIQVLNRSGEIQWVSDQPPTHRFHPPPLWRPSEAIEESWNMIVPVGTPTGEYSIRLRVVDPQGRPLSMAAGLKGRPADPGQCGDPDEMMRFHFDRSSVGDARPRSSFLWDGSGSFNKKFFIIHSILSNILPVPGAHEKAGCPIHCEMAARFAL